MLRYDDREHAVSERYERQKLVGQGQMSEVWLARDIQKGDLVALKIMTTVVEDDRRNQKALERFYREIQIARSLSHPRILPILNYGHMDYHHRSVPFLVSPYYPEGSLADLIGDRPPWEYWSLQQTADAIVQAAESLWYLHTRSPQIVHEDVKPGNFLLQTVQGSEHPAERVVELYLCDFGISRWQQSTALMASELLGTFAFIAPEQVERKVHCASDQYALAVMACYLLTGKLPIQAATNEQYAQAHLHEQPLAPSQLNPQRIPSGEIDHVILRALEKQPGKRYPTIMEFAYTLQQTIMAVVENFAATPTERLDPFGERTSRLVVERGAGPLEGKGAPFLRESLDDAPIVIDPPDTDEGRVLDEPLPPKPVKVVRAEQMRPVSTELSLQRVANIMLPARPKMIDWSRDGQYVGAALYGAAPVVIFRDGTLQQIQTTNALQAAAICWSADGRVLAVCSQNEIRFWDIVARSELQPIGRYGGQPIKALDWSAKDQLAVWVESQIAIYTLPDVAQMSQLPLPSQTITTGALRPSSVTALRWSPDGKTIAVGSANGAVICWQTERPQPAWQVVASGQKVNCLAWSPDGLLLVVAFKDNRVVGWNSQNRERSFVWERLPFMPRSISISPHYRITLASSEQRLLSGTPNEPFPSAVSPGQLLASWSPTAEELATLDELRENIVTMWRA